MSNALALKLGVYAASNNIQTNVASFALSYAGSDNFVSHSFKASGTPRTWTTPMPTSKVLILRVSAPVLAVLTLRSTAVIEISVNSLLVLDQDVMSVVITEGSGGTGPEVVLFQV